MVEPVFLLLVTAISTADSDSSKDFALLHAFRLVLLSSDIPIGKHVDRAVSITLVGTSSSTLIFFYSAASASFAIYISIFSLGESSSRPLVLDKFDHGYCKGEGINKFRRSCVNARGLQHTLVWPNFPCRINEGTPKTSGQGSVAHGLHHANHLRVQAGFRSLEYISNEAFDGVLNQGRNTGVLLAHRSLQSGHEIECVDRIRKKGRSSHSGLSARIMNVSFRSALIIGAATLSNALFNE